VADAAWHEDETLVWALYQQGQERLREGNPGAAVEVLELAVEREPAKASLREVLGRAYFAAARLEPARRQFEQALDLNPADDYAHFGMGRCLERQGRLPSAAKHYKLACALAPREDYRSALGRVLRRMQVTDE
jgi:tetratricopeptide (TPR) repeat protein